MASPHFYPEDTWKRDVERRLAALETAPRLQNSAIGAGGLDVVGGNIEIFDALNALLVTLDENGLDIGSGLVVVDDTGINVGAGEVVLNNTGLTVAGGAVRAIDIASGFDTHLNTSLTTTYQTTGSVSYTVPSWANSVLVVLLSWTQMTNGSGGVQGINVQNTIEGTTYGNAIQDIQNGQIGSAVKFNTEVLTSWTGTVDVSMQTRVTVGTNSTNTGSIQSFAVFLR